MKVKRDLFRDSRLVGAGIAGGLFVWFALTNLSQVNVHFWIFSAKSPVVVVIVLSGLLGLAAGILVSRHRNHSQRRS